MLQDIQHEAKRCAGIVWDLLTFSHVEQDEDEAYQKGSLTEILGQVLRLLCYRIEKQGVSVTQHIADDTPDIWMNPNSVQQLILNLIANALDALEDNWFGRNLTFPEFELVCESKKGNGPDKMAKVEPSGGEGQSLGWLLSHLPVFSEILLHTVRTRRLLLYESRTCSP
jgi:hypothetical protein